MCLFYHIWRLASRHKTGNVSRVLGICPRLAILREVEQISLWESLKVRSSRDTMSTECHDADGPSF